MFEGHPLAVTAQLRPPRSNSPSCTATVPSSNLTRIHFCVPAATIKPTGQLATLT